MKEARETLTLNTLHDSTHTKTWRGIRGQSDTDWAPPDVRREDHVVWNPNAFNVFFPNPQHSLTKSLWQNQDKSISISLSVSLHLPLLPHICPLLFSSPPRHLLNSEDWLSSGIGSEGTSGAQALLESRLRHAPHHLSVKTTSAARSALSGRGRPDRPRLGASVNIKTTLNFRCHMFWPALKLKRYRRNYPTCLWVKKQTMHQNGWWADDSKPLFYFEKLKRFWVNWEQLHEYILKNRNKPLERLLVLFSYLFNYIINWYNYLFSFLS